MARLDLVGLKVGDLTVLSRAPTRGPNGYWLCRCGCGSEKEYQTGQLQLRKVKSCGCRRGELIRASKSTHGKTKTVTFGRWRGMITRCENHRVSEYPLYGGRGISVCARWRQSFVAFLEDMGEAPKGMSLDRIDVNGNYEPSNCRWATAVEQANNRRSTRYVIVGGERMCTRDAAVRFGVPAQMIRYRLDRGWSDEAAVGLRNG